LQANPNRFLFCGVLVRTLLCLIGIAFCNTAFAATADLKVDVRAPSWDQPQPLGQRFMYSIIVSNAGPDVASNVVVTNDVREPFSEPTVTVSQGIWSLIGRSLRSELGNLDSGSIATVAVEVTPTNSAYIFMEAGANSSTFDPTWPNKFYTQLQLGVTDLRAQIEIQTNLVVAGVPFQLTSTVTNRGPDPAEDVIMFSSGNSDFVPAAYTLTQGEVIEFREGGLPWQINFGRIPAHQSASMTIGLIPKRTGELYFSSGGTSLAFPFGSTNASIQVVAGAGLIGFASAEIKIRENARVASMEVRRREGTDGRVEVIFTTEDGTAISGQDFEATSGRLTFAPGESSKTISVPILDNAQTECNRQLSLRLTSVTRGAFLFGITNASIFISDDELTASGSLDLVSWSTNRLESGSGESALPGLSADGRWLVFASFADNLIPHDTNEESDVFLKDLRTGLVRLVNEGPFVTGGSSGSIYPAMTPDGRFVAFLSYATNLVTNVVSGVDGQIYVRDMISGAIRLVTATAEGRGADAGNGLSNASLLMGVSTNGQVFAFLNDGRELSDGDQQLFVRNMERHETRLITARYEGGGPALNQYSLQADLSADGKMIAFISGAQDIIKGFSNPGGRSQIYVRDLVNEKTYPVSIRHNDGAAASDSSFSPLITADNRYVVFQSLADDLVENDDNPYSDIFIRDLASNRTRRLSEGVAGPCEIPRASADGRFVVFRGGFRPGEPGPTPSANSSQIYVTDSWSNVVSLVSINCSGNGPGNGHARNPTISADGRYVFFQSFATDLVPGVFDSSIVSLYRRDLIERKTVLVSINRTLTGGPSNPSQFTDGVGFSYPALSADGRVATFASGAGDLAWGDGNGLLDVFIWRADHPHGSGPALRIDREDKDILVRWSHDATNFVLQSATNPSGPTWMDFVTTNTAFRFEASERGFFRLKESVR
jgi:Tol biopolymer transport system component